MNSVQESKNELEASIRYAENAISSAKQTIESMEFRQEMAQKNYQEQTGREQALQNQVDELKSKGALLAERIDEMKSSAFADTKTIEHLKDQNLELKEKVQAQLGDIDMLKQQRTVRAEARDEEVGALKSTIAELESKVQGQYDDIVQLERDLTVKTSQAEAWKKEARETKEGAPTMPVIPKDVAIAIFREGTLFGVEAACDEIQGESINISESNYVGDFHVSFERDIDLDDHIDFDWVRSKVGDYDEDNVAANLEGLCAKNHFECRIHGIDDQEEKKND